MDKPNRLILGEGEHAGALRHTAVSHLAFTVPDVDAAEQFYTRVLGLVRHEGLDDGGARLGWGAGHHVLDLLPGPAGIAHFGFEVRDEDGLAAVESRLRAAGVDVRPLDAGYLDAAIGSASGIETTTPEGTTVHFHTAVQRQGENAGDPGRRPLKYQHVTMGTADLAATVSFFVDVIGFRISDQLADGRFCWLRSDKDHHTLAIVQTGHAGVLDHYSYDLAQWEDFKTWCDRLTELDVDVQWGPGRHGPGNNLFVFFDDPAGNHIELSAEMEKFYDDRVAYVPRRWEPVPSSVNLWGGQLPGWRRTSEQKSERASVA